MIFQNRMRNGVLAGFVVIAAAVIVASFFMPWAKVSVSAAKISEGLTGVVKGKVKDAALAEKLLKGIEKAVSKIGDVGIEAVVSGSDIPAMIDKQSSKAAISLLQVFFKDVKDLDKKSKLVYAVPLLAFICAALAVVGMKKKAAVVAMLVLSGAVSFAGLFKVYTTNLSGLAAQITIGSGLWQTLYAYLAIFILSIVWLLAQGKER